MSSVIIVLFFFHLPLTTKIYTLSLHDALPIYGHDPAGAVRLRGRPVPAAGIAGRRARGAGRALGRRDRGRPDRKSTRLNSSHLVISYAVFCLKKKKKLLKYRLL